MPLDLLSIMVWIEACYVIFDHWVLVTIII